MAGNNISVEYDDSRFQKALQRLEQLGGDLTPVMMEIAVALEHSTREHFDNEEDPEGNSWAPLQASTLERKSRQGVPVDQVLHGESLHLRDTLFPFWSSGEAGISTGPGTEAYAATHQFGDDSRNIPARPFLGIGPADEAEILEILESALEDRLGG